ncbi:MAG: CinA family protein [Treponema sp.]|jgi:PncC family amidohydrolase|nr:CinA family protein [Treponema sp.]
MEDRELTAFAKKAAQLLINKLSERSHTLALAESCTAGLVSSLLASVPGASDALWGSFVCYSQAAKISMLSIPREKLLNCGLVSGETAALMAASALERSGADIAAAVTGLAGPKGDGSNVAVGTVWVATSSKNAMRDGTSSAREFHFSGSRNEVRLRAATAVFECLQNALT